MCVCECIYVCVCVYIYIYIYLFRGLPCGSTGKESACNAGNLGSIPGLGRFPWRRERLLTPGFWPGEFHGLFIVHGVAKSQTWLSNFHFHICVYTVLIRPPYLCVYMYVCILVYVCTDRYIHVCACPVVSDSEILWSVVRQAPLSMENSPCRNTGVANHFVLQAVSVQFSCSVVSDSLWPHGLQHVRPPCPSPTPKYEWPEERYMQKKKRNTSWLLS